jgi:general secretion pathway protein C
MPRQIHILFNLLALFIITYILVDMFYNVFNIKLYNIGAPKVVALKDVEIRGDEALIAPEYAMIEERNIFGATKEVAPPLEEKVEEVEFLQETSLQLSLLGTIAGDTESARAIILDERTRSQDIYKVGDSVQEAVIRQILRGKVVLRHAGKDEILIMVEGEGKAKEPPVAVQRGRTSRRPRDVSRNASQEEAAGEVEVETVAIDQELLQSSMSDLNALMTQVRVRPYFRQGIPEGLIVSQIQPDSIFEKMGFMNGDIIASVNGKQMSTPEEAFQLYNSLQSGAAVSIEITRRGQKRMLTYQIQ